MARSNFLSYPICHVSVLPCSHLSAPSTLKNLLFGFERVLMNFASESWRFQPVLSGSGELGFRPRRPVINNDYLLRCQINGSKCQFSPMKGALNTCLRSSHTKSIPAQMSMWMFSGMMCVIPDQCVSLGPPNFGASHCKLGWLQFTHCQCLLMALSCLYLTQAPKVKL